MTIDEKLKAFFEGKKVVILGFGREGRSTLKLLGSCNCKSITVADMNGGLYALLRRGLSYLP